MTGDAWWHHARNRGERVFLSAAEPLWWGIKATLPIWLWVAFLVAWR